MCIECGCQSVGSETGIVPVSIIDMTSQGASGLTLDMTSTSYQRESFIEESPLHEMGEGIEDPD
jgi:hypothetical protein